MTSAESDRINNDEDKGILDCPYKGATMWDYGPIGPDDARGRKPEDALRGAIEALTETIVSRGPAPPVPVTGWVELTKDSEASRVVFVHTIDNWRWVIYVGGDPEIGVWRYHKAFICST
jgi:hypothetical protein